MYDKNKLIQQLISEIQKDLDVLTRAAIEAREAATHSESKQEGKYDTRGLEASYLAGAQAKRAMELENSIQFLKTLNIKKFSEDDDIRATALIELDDEGEKVLYFLVPQSGGATLKQNNSDIKVIAANSPLGSELLGRKVGDTFEFKIGAKSKDFEIINIF